MGRKTYKKRDRVALHCRNIRSSPPLESSGEAESSRPGNNGEYRHRGVLPKDNVNSYF